MADVNYNQSPSESALSLPGSVCSRRGGRVVDGSGLENRRTRKGTGGSNPSLSASYSTHTTHQFFYNLP